MYWHLQHLGWNHSGICESPMYYTQQWKHWSVLQFLPKKKHSQETGFAWKLQPWLVFPITPQNMPFAKGYYNDNAEPAVFSTEILSQCYSLEALWLPWGPSASDDGKKRLGKWYQVINSDQQVFLVSECSEN